MALYDKASLVLIPSQYKEGKLYNIKPLKDSFEFERGSAATRVNSDGLIETFDSSKHDTPRLDYSGTEPSLLLEPQRTNELPHSEDFTSWNSINVDLESNSIISPDGTQNATKLIPPSGTSNTYYVRKTGVVGDVMSVFAKKGEKSKILLYSGVSNSNAYFDLDSGEVLTTLSDISSASIEDFGNGWYRCSVVLNTPSIGFRIYAIDNDNSLSVVGNGVDGIYIYGGQLEQGSYATSYIPTNGTTETRLADVCQGGGDASVFNDSEGVLYAEVSRLNGDLSATTITINKGGSEFSGFSFRTDGKIWAATYNGSSYENILQYTPTDFYDTYKICYKYKNNDFAFWVNGVEVDSNLVNTLTLTGLNDLSFSSGTATNKFLGNVKALHYFPEALTDTELQQLTTI